MVLGGFPTAHAETFKFESKTSLQSYAATIGGELSFPQGRGPFPVVILLHACGGLDPTGKASLSAHAQSLTKVGFATYILDSFSARGLTADKVCKGGGEASEFRLDDLFNAREALQKHTKIDTARFFVVGQSHGATVALSAAVNLNKREPFRAVAAFYPSCRSSDGTIHAHADLARNSSSAVARPPCIRPMLCPSRSDHTYATFRLHEGVNQYALARNMGTSVQMLETFYGHTTNRTMATELTKNKGRQKKALE
jgi:dienelactone hydrolase